MAPPLSDRAKGVSVLTFSESARVHASLPPAVEGCVLERPVAGRS